MQLCGIYSGIAMVSLKNSLKLVHNVVLLKQLAKRWITVLSSKLQSLKVAFLENEKMFVKI